MAFLSGAGETGARWQRRARALFGRDRALEAVLSWIRGIALEADTFHLETPEREGTYHHPLPSFPRTAPRRADHAGAAARARFIVRRRAAGAAWPGRGEAAEVYGAALPVGGAAFRPILRLDDLEVYERDAPHGRERPLRLGLDQGEGRILLAHARGAVERALGMRSSSQRVAAPPPPRLGLRAPVAVAVWTRGRLRGSMIAPAGPTLRGVAQAAAWAARDARFARVTPGDLDETVLQVGLLHAPTIPLSEDEVTARDAYADKVLTVSDGLWAGSYMPEIFNVLRLRTLRQLAVSLAVDKLGLPALRPGARVEVAEVSEVVESADRARALCLDGPVACAPDGISDLASSAEACGRAASDWLAAIQADDGLLPLRVRPSTGASDGEDPPRVAMTAQGLAAFGLAAGYPPAVETARRAVDWLERTQPRWDRDPRRGLLTAVYLGKTALLLRDEPRFDRAVARALDASGAPGGEPLVLAHLASLLRSASSRNADAALRSEALDDDLRERFERVRRAGAPLSLAGWAEVAAAVPGTPASREVVGWLLVHQLANGAFPDTTASSHVYTRGTAKIFEVLALDADTRGAGVGRALRFLLSMQYSRDSTYFIPTEHRPRLLGGFRSDWFDTDAWIDSAGHALLGVARILSR